MAQNAQCDTRPCDGDSFVEERVTIHWILLIGLPIIVVGFLVRLPVTLIVLLAGVATGVAGGMPFVGTRETPGILDSLGKAFAD